MGLFLCQICDEQLSFTESHVCKQEDIVNYIQRLRDDANRSRNFLNDIQNAVLMILQSLPTLDDEQILVETKWLRKLWDAAQCQWHENKSVDKFLVRWIALHRTLSESFNLFRSKNHKTLLEKLTAVREMCDSAKKVLGYEDSRFDLTPEDLVSQK